MTIVNDPLIGMMYLDGLAYVKALNKPLLQTQVMAWLDGEMVRQESGRQQCGPEGVIFAPMKTVMAEWGWSREKIVEWLADRRKYGVEVFEGAGGEEIVKIEDKKFIYHPGIWYGEPPSEDEIVCIGLAAHQRPPRACPQPRKTLSPKTQTIKRQFMRLRRDEFSRLRSRLVLAMIEAGQEYVCAWDGCRHAQSLTIDHKIPLSRGGSDDTSNLQFLCRKHNSAKGDRLH